MPVERGMTFTPDKKKMLLDEVQSEINKVNETIQFKKGVGGAAMQTLKDNRQKLQDILKVLFDTARLFFLLVLFETKTKKFVCRFFRVFFLFC